MVFLVVWAQDVFCNTYAIIFIIDIPIPSMYGIFTYIWLISMVNVGKYTVHGCYGTYRCFIFKGAGHPARSKDVYIYIYTFTYIYIV